MEEQKKPEENPGLVPERLGCHYCERTFKTQSSRANHHKRQHPNKHRWMKGHRKSPDYICKHCNIGFGSSGSRCHHQKRCQSNPEVLKELKKKLKMQRRQQEEEKNQAD